MIVQIIMLTCDLSNIQECNFKECPLNWVVPLAMFLS
jgi:hypothetical protein